MGTIVESGAIYSVSVCIFIVLITYATKTNGVYTAYNALAQVVGINSVLIIVRTGLGLPAHGTTYRAATRNIDTLFSSGRSRSQRSDANSGVYVHRVTQMQSDEGHEEADRLDDISQPSKRKVEHV
ncbi:hypothetical protein Moror_10021 [Moniliophthora roreri MCA 2997]|uniref:Uncharacterized protein n=2 Tax=Moniliophthora roreri TaxID=221103 RepID=V2WYE5_MONRO|nr:hypothetical protein Moror_10021 [Moniliophthora roreri MCA 2997]